MATDIVTLMEFEEGNLSEREIVEMLSHMIQEGELDTLPEKFSKLARKYNRLEIIDEEGNINYIKLSLQLE
jgi:hypothetical protein